MNLVEKAIIFATNAHAGTCRKGKNRPYIMHPLEAMTIVGTLTDEEETLAAAVLHDTVEDTDVTAVELEKEFGQRVAELVTAESENKRPGQSAAATWKERKEEALAVLQEAGRPEKLICLGDKLANLREISRDYAVLGDELWQRFNQKDKNEHGWYYGSIYKILVGEFGDAPVMKEYASLLEQVFRETGM